MCTVSYVSRNVKQPRGGYIKPSQFQKNQLDDGKILNPEENIHSSVIGMTVEYLTRYLICHDRIKAFEISCKGARACSRITKSRKVLLEVSYYLLNIKGLDDRSIRYACKMTTFDVWYRNPISALCSKRAKETEPDKDTIENIRIMVERSLRFFEKYGPVSECGVEFDKSCFTDRIMNADADFLTADTLWDFKVLKANITNEHTLQLIIYWILGQHSNSAKFKNIDKIGIYNPRSNMIYLLNIDDISSIVISDIEKNVIGY